MTKTKEPCRYYSTYKAVYKPKCNCQPCLDLYDMKQQGTKK